MDPRVRYSGNWVAFPDSDGHEPYALGITADAVARINFVGKYLCDSSLRDLCSEYLVTCAMSF